MKIILINFTGGIPLGLAYLSAAVSDLPNRIVRIIDCGDDECSQEKRLEIIRLEKPDVIGATVYTYHASDILNFMYAVKQLNPSILTVVGGPHPTALPGTIANDESIDVVVFGEGELTFKLLIDRWERGKSYSDLEGIAFFNKGKLTINKPRKFIDDLDSLPIPQWQDLPITTYTHPDYGHPRMNKKNFMNMLATRGCPYSCTFCGAADVWGRNVRKHSPKRIVHEMRLLHDRYGVHSVRFVDSTFTIDRNWMLEFCDTLQKEDLDIAWSVNARANTLYDDLLIEMKKAKCTTITIGVESGDENVLRMINKNQNLDQVRDAFHKMKKHGIFSWGFFMIGCPGETKESIKKTIEFAEEIDPDQVSICAFAIPYPGTKFYKLAKKEGHLADIPWKDFHHSRKIIYVPKGLSKNDIEEGKRLFCERLQPHKRNKRQLFL